MNIYIESIGIGWHKHGRGGGGEGGMGGRNGWDGGATVAPD